MMVRLGVHLRLRKYIVFLAVVRYLFKRLYGEYCMAKNMETIAKELAVKAYIYNMIINLQS